MANQGVNSGRRRFLTASTAVVGGVGTIFAAVPFIKSWEPSARAQVAGAPVEVDISKVEPGQRLTVKWRGKPVWLVHRTEEQLAALGKHDGRLKDAGSENTEQQPEYAKNALRSIKPEMLVLVGICTHLGCVPRYVPELEPQPFDSEWPGGFFCPCHNSRFDLAGRVFDGSPAGANLKVPDYHYVDDRNIVIGVAPQGAA
ncbi:MAG: ubiquinol-cytochrome c reductase iron-sulfur subunit [Rhodanobacteraceae bacterium]|nr:ubiquinol-cytochrome c reductase iron-sulfur subunit [Xanthomonadales bacterium]MCP5477667.1 ubiquinol-cytochrome c reductase iron-sulfur subunit [Rhodanobacteraceae bacterium]HPF72691.1 ubiquinol-cytochrome c reductase iron-sulfur subunit [Xanthomonadaceae bacterium]HRY00488.1 ubiquinol-cytochrome c reductase iron-sulfur subunit [Xanthomonadaceae bacterium]